MFILRFLSSLLIKFLASPSSSKGKPTHDFSLLEKNIQPGDVLLVEGNQRFSTAIKYLTQSNWSHAAICIGEGKIIEADLEEGVIQKPLDKYRGYHTRVCRPKNLLPEDLEVVLQNVKNQIGHTYDLKNIVDLARYLFPTPPIPTKWRRSLLQFGSGNPSKVICSSMIALAFQAIKFPILPVAKCAEGKCIFTTRYHALFTPSDFDRSPYFEIIKPSTFLEKNYRNFVWSEGEKIELK